ncbi:MAG TPA: UdgX family uracil-DNA binding protein [Schlesneria sp.]|jgi:DNA polymerase
MQTYTVETFEAWRGIARQLLRSRVSPGDVCFHEQSSQGSLFDADDGAPLPQSPTSDAATTVIPVPPKFLEIARVVACHRDDDRFQLLYRLLWRLTTTDSRLLEVHTDDDVYRLRRMEKAVRRDIHKMHAFVRFRKVVSNDGEQFIAWHRPDHRIVRLATPFFARRFPAMNWAILTPDESVVWDQTELVYGPGCSQKDAPEPDDLEDLWRTYYGAIFNPARIKLKAMVREMPIRHWKTLPETEIIQDLLADAPRRVAEMIARQEGHARSAADHIPAAVTWEALRDAAATCRGCDLYRDATQTVFGEGPRNARIVFVGEQPGDSEDIAGRPFVGPAGEVLNDALTQAGLKREEIYVTNAVKHFKFERTETRRLHKKPSAREASSCRPWIEAELNLIKPDILVCLGATAAQSLIAPGFSITRQRGEFLPSDWCESTIATYHPSAILRSPTPAQRQTLLTFLVQDLIKVRERTMSTPSQRDIINDARR